MLARLEQPENVSSSILVTAFGIVILERLEQPENAPSPIISTEPGMDMLLRLELYSNLQVVLYQLFAR